MGSLRPPSAISGAAFYRHLTVAQLVLRRLPLGDRAQHARSWTARGANERLCGRANQWSSHGHGSDRRWHTMDRF